jgi:hypothetical protein
MTQSRLKCISADRSFRDTGCLSALTRNEIFAVEKPAMRRFPNRRVDLLIAIIFHVFANLATAEAEEGDSTLTAAESANQRLRIIVETDAGGDPDDEQSLVRFLLYSNEWDVEGIICNRAEARDGENLNSERTGLGIVERLVRAYGECYPHLIQHDASYPKPEVLLQRTVPGYEDSNEGLQLILAAVDSDDPRPVWFLNWGTDHGSAPSSLKLARIQEPVASQLRRPIWRAHDDTPSAV